MENAELLFRWWMLGTISTTFRINLPCLLMFKLEFKTSVELCIETSFLIKPKACVTLYITIPKCGWKVKTIKNV